MADVVAPIAEISRVLVKHSTYLFLSRANSHDKEGVAGRLAENLGLVRTKTAHDFTAYKTGTLTRRIERRMAAAAITDAGRYADKLRADTVELDSLAQDLLINVTSLFVIRLRSDAYRKRDSPDHRGASGRSAIARLGSGLQHGGGSLFAFDPVSGGH